MAEKSDPRALRPAPRLPAGRSLCSDPAALAEWGGGGGAAGQRRAAQAQEGSAGLDLGAPVAAWRRPGAQGFTETEQGASLLRGPHPGHLLAPATDTQASAAGRLCSKPGSRRASRTRLANTGKLVQERSVQPRSASRPRLRGNGQSGPDRQEGRPALRGGA